MGMGKTIGESFRKSVDNSTSIYPYVGGVWNPNPADTTSGTIRGNSHMSLMGDPTLRLKYVAPPSSLTLSNSGGNVAMSWGSSSDPGVGYNVYEIQSNQIRRVNSSVITGLNYTSTDAFTNGRKYMVTRVKVEQSNSGTYYNESLGKIATTSGVLPTAPSAPTGVSGSAVSSSQINVAWTDTSNNELTFTLERASNSSFTSPTVVSSTIPAGTTSYSVSGLGAGLQYFFRVKAVNATGSSAWANSAGVTTSSAGGTGGGQVLGLMGMAGPDNNVNITPGSNPYGKSDYFLSCTNGNDSNNGTSISTPWATMTRLDAQKYQLEAGNRVFFQRGCKFRGMIHVVKSGTSSQPIEYSAYGTGLAPIISGMNKVTTSWASQGGNIWKTSLAPGQDIKYLFVASSPQNLARHPNTGWLSSSPMTSTSITNSWIGTQSTANLTGGANIVMRDSPWSYRKLPVLSKSGSTVTFAASGFCCNWESDGWGFFFENKLALLDTAGEWYYNSSTGELFFWAPNNADPNTLTIETSNQSRGVDIGYQISNLKFNNLILEGYTQYAFHSEDNKNVTFNNMEIRYSDKALQIYTDANTNTNSADGHSFKLSYIHDIYNDGVWFMGRNNNHLVEGNVFRDLGTNIQLGANTSGWNLMGINMVGSASKYTIRRNIIDNTGYIGLVATGSSLVEENYVTRASSMLNDGAGISFDHADGLIVRKNIVKDTLYDLISMPNLYEGYKIIGNGIYWGNHCIRNTVVTENTVINSTGSGIWWDHPNCGQSGFSTSNFVTNNTIYDSKFAGIGFSDYGSTTLGSFPFLSQKGDTLTGNKIYSLNQEQIPLHLFDVTAPSGQNANWGVFNNNYFYQPFSTTKINRRHFISGVITNFTLPQWQAASGDDLNSRASNYTLPAGSSQTAQIFINPSTSSITQNVVNGCDSNGNTMSGPQTIAPFGSLVVEYYGCNQQ